MTTRLRPPPNDPYHPLNLSPEERLAEVSGLLATALLRLQAVQAKTVSEPARNELDLSRETPLHADDVNSSVEGRSR